VNKDLSKNSVENSELLTQTYPNFHSYILHREEILSEISETLGMLPSFVDKQTNLTTMRKKAKKLITVFLYGGSFKNWIKSEGIDEMVPSEEVEAQFQGALKKRKEFSLVKFREELVLISELIWKNWTSPHQENSEFKNAENKIFEVLKSKICDTIHSVEDREHSEDINNTVKQYHCGEVGGRKEYFRFMSHVLQHEERKCLAIIEEELSRNDRYMDVYIHDGGLVRKKYTIKDFKNQLLEFKNLNQLSFLRQESERFASEIQWEQSFPDDILRRCEEEIEKILGYQVNIAIKEMHENETSSKIRELFKCQQESVLYKEILEIREEKKNSQKPKQRSPQTRRPSTSGDDEDDGYETDNEFENSLTFQINKDRLGCRYLARSYEELFYYYEVQNGLAFIKDRGCYVDKDGRVFSEENFKRSMPYKICLLKRKSPAESKEGSMNLLNSRGNSDFLLLQINEVSPLNPLK
jgi:hypothetical protein